MPKRSRKQTAKPAKSKPKTLRTRPKRVEAPDANQTAYGALQAVIDATEGTGKDPLAVLLGRRGGLKGGRARADKLSKEQRRESAVKAARARWDRKAKSEQA